MKEGRTMSPNFFLKGIAVLMLYVLLAHPSAYPAILKERNWYVIICGIVAVPVLLVWSANVLVWRIRISSSTIEIRSLRGVLKATIRRLRKGGTNTGPHCRSLQRRLQTQYSRDCRKFG
jgi:hypothetical protein